MKTTTQSLRRCACGRPISANKEFCAGCLPKARSGDGVLEILNVQGGDIKVTFDKDSPQESIRARRIVQDMLRRGYALIVEVERDGKKAYERVQEFDAERGEYLVADFEPLEADRSDAEEISDAVVEELSRPDALPRLAGATEDGGKLCKCGRPAKHRGACKGTRIRLPMEKTKATGIGRSAGG